MSLTSPQNSEPRSLIRYGLVGFAITLIAMWTLYLVRGPVLLLYVCALFAAGLTPLVRWIERQRFLTVGKRRMPKPLAVLIIYGTVIGTLAGIGFAVVPQIVQQSQQFAKELPNLLDKGQQQLAKWGLISPDTSFKELLQQSPIGGGDAVTMVLGAVWGFVGGLFGTVTILLLTFYMLVESQRIFDFFVRLFPRQRRPKVAEVSQLVQLKVSAWLGGQIFLGFVIGATTAIGLGLMGVPYFFVLALIAGIGEMIPMVGPLISAVPAILVAFTVSPGLAFGVAVFFLVQQQLENAVLVPKLMGETVGLNAVTVISALLIGSELLGFSGALLAVPTAAIIQVLIEELYLAEKAPA
jgi:predicted PurR-regulated permease PerM